MSEELIPCPFCGSHNVRERECSSPELAVMCSDCGAGAFLSAWNTRPTEDALRADLARKDAEIAALEELVEAQDCWINNYYGPRNPEWRKRKSALDSARAKLAEMRGEGKA